MSFNPDIQRFFALMTAYNTTNDAFHLLRSTLAQKNHLSLGDAQNLPACLALAAEASRIHQEAQALTPHVIRANLQNMGINDMQVTGILYFSNNLRTPNGVHFHDGEEAGRITALLSDLCGLRYANLAKKLGVDEQVISLHIVIENDGKVLGKVDCDGDFDYSAAPDLRTALGWKVATDGGRVRIIESFDLDGATKMLTEIISSDQSEEVFFGAYFQALKKIFISEHTSRFGDGYCGAATLLWRVAIRQLFGKEHPGYNFCY